jgi:DNA-directed RNA polymerase subunit M
LEFCDKCGGLLIPKRAGSKTVLECRKCGRRRAAKSKDFKISVSTNTKPEKIIIVDKKSRMEGLPKTLAQCPKCEHNEAYWWMQQTRAADEPPTRFFKCVKCGHVWREYE